MIAMGTLLLPRTIQSPNYSNSLLPTLSTVTTKSYSHIGCFVLATLIPNHTASSRYRLSNQTSLFSSSPSLPVQFPIATSPHYLAFPPHSHSQTGTTKQSPSQERSLMSLTTATIMDRHACFRSKASLLPRNIC